FIFTSVKKARVLFQYRSTVLTVMLFACFTITKNSHSQSLIRHIHTYPDSVMREYIRQDVRIQYQKDSANAFREMNTAIDHFRSKGKKLIVGYIYQAMAALQRDHREYKKSLLSADKAIQTFTDISNKENLLYAIIFKAGLFQEIGKNNDALKLLFDMLKKHKGIPAYEFAIYSNIGQTFLSMKNHAKAEEYLLIAENKYKEVLKKNSLIKETIINVYKNLGAVYHAKKQFDKASENFDKAMEKAETVGSTQFIGPVYNELGSFYKETGKYEKAIECFEKSVPLKERDGNYASFGNAEANIGRIYTLMGRTAEAEAHLRRGYEIMEEIGSDREGLLNAVMGLADLYKNNPAKAYPFLAEAVVLKDSVYASNVAAESARMEAIYENDKNAKKIELTNAKNNELKSINALKDRQNKWMLIGLGVVIILLAGAIWSYLGKLKSNKLLEEKNVEVIRQKMLVEQHNKEIVDSINYAQKIQAAILPAEEDFKKVLGDCFILFKPKDIVSGDFYWIAEKGIHTFYATVDCTGHGVPGGFMSVLAASLLNEIVNELNITEPDEILNRLRKRIIHALKQTGEAGENKDGMDMTICRYNRNTKELALASANNPVWIVHNGELTEVKPDKFPVGISPYENEPFTKQVFTLSNDDIVYTFTDGFADQFGGPKGKKLKYKNLATLLLTNHKQSMTEQSTMLNEEFEKWKGDLEQLDDICVIGIRV
ncbi:MAG TPA: tetratricopeptide repeat protein, partial [Flavobacteriales bacterium]|nr:tetratricopeptide repeat protein [Flavobacteriales bacterium]